MNDNQCISNCVKYVVLGVITLFVLGVTNCQMTRYNIRKAIENGASPLAAECALSDAGMDCSVLAASEAERSRVP